MAQDYALDVGVALELPKGAATAYTAHVLWGDASPDTVMTAAQPVMLHLAPFEVVTLELTPNNG
ncbi:MAG: hypothetical protein WDN06_05370 [Asticcacaulis sp.]